MKNFWELNDVEEITQKNVVNNFSQLREGYSNYSDERNNREISFLRELYRRGEIRLDENEKEILQFCHDRDMVQFLREEFEKHPIILNEDGSLKYGNPFEKERQMRAILEQEQNNTSF